MYNSQSRDYSQEDSPPRRGGVPLSYAYGAPTLAKNPTQTSPHRHPSPTRSSTSSVRNRHTGAEDHEDDQGSNISNLSTATGQEPGVVRYARLKQRNQALGTSSFHNTAPGGPGIIISPPNGEKLRDTSVNVATAFHQAASNVMSPTGQPVQTRRIAAPPSKVRKPNSTASTRSVTEDASERGARAKSPILETMSNVSQAIARAVSPTTYLLKEPLFQPFRAEEPPPPAKPPSRQDTKESTVPSNDSYDYEAEERIYRGEAPAPTYNKPASHQRKKSTSTSAAARLAMDNKAYRPPSDDEDDDEYASDEHPGRRRKKKKKDDGKSSLSLPTIGYDKRRKKRKSGAGAHEDEDEETASAEEQSPYSLPEDNARPPSRPPSRAGSRAGSVSRDSVPPSHPAHFLPQETLEVVPETQEDEMSIPGPDFSQESVEPPPQVKPRGASKDRPPLSKTKRRSKSRDRTSPHAGTSSKVLSQLEAQRQSTPAPHGIGSFLGRIVHWLITSVARRIIQVISFIFFLIWTLIAGVFSTLIMTPIRWISSGTSSAARDLPLKNLVKMVIFTAIIGVTAFALHPSSEFGSSVGEWIWSVIPVRRPAYHAPSIPAESVEDLITRLTQVENALANFASSSSSREQQSQKQSQRALDQLHSRLEAEAQRAHETEERYRTAAAQGLAGLRRELESLQSEWVRVRSADNKDELHNLQERMGSMEGTVKEALELAKKADHSPDVKSQSKWNSGSSLTIKSSDGQDVGALIGSMVEQAVSRFYKDGIAKPDFALYSAGARVVPSLTSNTYEVKPKSWPRYLVGALTGVGYTMGRPPVMALHPDVHVGNCWPMIGTRGQLGVVLARNVYISEITIEHTPKDVAFDVRTAPRQMEFWGLVEGADNVAKVRDYQRAAKERREEIVRRAKAEGVEPPPDDDAYPRSLPRSPSYLRLAQFTYDIHASDHLQTFTVPQEIQDIGADFGVVVLMINNNWGEEDYTCLYRVRVHGVEKDRRPLHLPEEDSP